MAIIKKSELKKLSAGELREKLKEIEREISSELSAMKTSGRPSNPGRFRGAKRLKARILTLLTLKGENN